MDMFLSSTQNIHFGEKLVRIGVDLFPSGNMFCLLKMGVSLLKMFLLRTHNMHFDGK